jgi:hypothetical protein
MKTRLLFTAAGIALLLAAPLQAQTTTTGSSFDALSPGNQKIANALFNAQTTNGTTTPLTRDQIADLKKSEGWGQVFKQMKTDGLVQARNLGQVVSGHYSPNNTTTAGTNAAAARSTTATTRTGMTRGRFGMARASARMHSMGGSRVAGGFGSTRGFGRAYYGGGFAHPMSGGFAHPMGGGFAHPIGGGFGGGMGGGMGGGFGHGGGHGR